MFHDLLGLKYTPKWNTHDGTVTSKRLPQIEFATFTLFYESSSSLVLPVFLQNTIRMVFLRCGCHLLFSCVGNSAQTDTYFWNQIHLKTAFSRRKYIKRFPPTLAFWFCVEMLAFSKRSVSSSTLKRKADVVKFIHSRERFQKDLFSGGENAVIERCPY